MNIIPPSCTEHKCPHANMTLQAVNGSPIATYGTRSLTLDLGLCCTFRWVFIMTDVEQPIFGADFLCHFHLLIDSTTQLHIQGITSKAHSPRILPQSPSNEFEALLADFPNLTQPRPINEAYCLSLYQHSWPPCLHLLSSPVT